MSSEGPLAVINCVCRQGMDLQGDPCKQTEIRETCLLLGEFAEQALAGGGARELSKEEMIGFLERADEIGMVLQPQNSQEPNFICCCCGCCCGVLSTAKRLPRPAEYFDTNYHAEVDADLCTECGTCGDRCEMDAITYPDGVAAVDLLRCIGCGLCVSTCPDGAIGLVEKDDAEETTEEPGCPLSDHPHGAVRPPGHREDRRQEDAGDEDLKIRGPEDQRIARIAGSRDSGSAEARPGPALSAALPLVPVANRTRPPPPRPSCRRAGR